jgi:MOSC domain-containing protein YiiM
MKNGIVVSIHIAGGAAAPMRELAEVRAVAGKGLDGDRYFSQAGTYSYQEGSSRHVTLIELEAVEAVKRDYGIELAAGETRRNIVTRGVALNHLVGKEFTIGEVRLRGTELCEPCAHFERLSRKGVQRALIHRGGVNAEILTDGVIRIGDTVDLGRSSLSKGLKDSPTLTVDIKVG